MEVKLKLLRWIEVVQDDEAARRFVAFDVAEIDGFSREGSHRTIVVEVGSTEWKILIELDFLGLILFQMVPIAAESESIGLSRWSLDIADFDWQV